ncbi:MAG: hypothetical protein ABI721_02540 [Candidatus Dojkabacteria bacterium]
MKNKIITSVVGFAIVSILALLAFVYLYTMKNSQVNPDNGTDTNGPSSGFFETKCLITVNGSVYNVTDLQSGYPHVFVCGTDMSESFNGTNGMDFQLIAPYKID